MAKGSQKKQSKRKPSTIAKYKRVIDEWLNNGENGTQAYLKIYPKAKEKTAVTNFKKILTIADIQIYVKQEKEKENRRVKAKHSISRESQLQRFKKVQKLVDDLFELLTVDDLTPKQKDKIKLLINALKVINPTRYNDMINKIIGAYSPIKVAETDAEGNDKVDYTSLPTEELIARAKAAKQIKDSKE